MVKNLPTKEEDARDAGLILGSGRSSGRGHDNLLQYPCLKNPMDRGSRQFTVHGVTKGRTRDLVTKQQQLQDV